MSGNLRLQNPRPKLHRIIPPLPRRLDRGDQFLAGAVGLDDAVDPAAGGAVAVYEFDLSAAEREAFTKSVEANTSLMEIARGFLG